MTRNTSQKAMACRLFAAGMPEVEATKSAGYQRPQRAAARLFKRDRNGVLMDDKVRDLVNQADEVLDDEGDVDLSGLPVEVLANLLRSHDTPSHVLQRAAATLDSIVNRDKTLTPGRPCPRCKREVPDTAGRGAFSRRAADVVAEILG